MSQNYNNSFSSFLSKVKKSAKYIALSFSMIFSEKRFKAVIWLLAIFLPAVMAIVDTKIFSLFIDGMANIIENGNGVWYTVAMFSILIAVRTATGLFVKIKDIVFEHLARDIDQKMAQYTIKRVASLDQINFDSSLKYAEIKGPINNELSLWSINWQIITAMSALITILGAAFITSRHRPVVILISFVLSICTFIISIVKSDYDIKAYKTAKIINSDTEYYSSLLTDSAKVKEIKLFSVGKQFMSHWEESYQNGRKEALKTGLQTNILQAVQYLLEALYIIIVVACLGVDVWHGNISIGDYYLYFANYALLFSAAAGISESVRDIFSLASEYDDFINFTEATAQGERNGNGISIPDKINIKFENVSFSYDDKPVLKNLSFEWKQGEKIMLIGRNGSGKSTLIKLLCGLYSCNSGRILINGVDVKEYKQDSLYKMFGVVYQDFCHYQLSVRENLAIQRLESANDDHELLEYLNRKNMSDVLEKLNEGLDTTLGRQFSENGIELSGGQWQKIAIARNEFGDRSCLIFDEPASALDFDSESGFFEDILRNDALNKNILIISHKLSMGRLADKILYLENGKIAEQGTHDKLMQQNGKYAQMYKKQSELYQNVKE